MTKVFSPWADSDPYRRGHVIRAEEVNVKFEGITTAFDELAKLLNRRVVTLPDSFDGDNVVDVGLVANTLLHINAEGNLSAYSLSAFENNVALTADYKDAAAGSASSASSSAGSASNSASTATAQANLAEKWAQHPENTAVESGKYSAYHWAQKAQEYAGAVDYNWSAIQGKPATATRWPSWGEVTSKPSTFTPSGHTHDWSQIKGNKGFLSGSDPTVVYGRSGLQFSNFSGAGGSGANGAYLKNPTNDWYYHLTQNHSNGNGYYVDIACHFHSDSVGFRRVTGGSDNGWCYFYHTGNKPSWSDIGGKPSTFQPIRNTNYTWTGKQRYNVTSDGFNRTGDASDGIEVYSANPNSATMMFHIGGHYATYFGLKHGSKRFGWGGWSAGAGFNALDSTKHYYNPGSVTLNDSRYRHTRCVAWSSGGTITIDGSAFEQGDVIEIINQRGTVTLTIYCNDGTIYLPDGSSGNTHTISKAGTVKLVKYSTSNNWMAQVY